MVLKKSASKTKKKSGKKTWGKRKKCELAATQFKQQLIAFAFFKTGKRLHAQIEHEIKHIDWTLDIYQMFKSVFRSLEYQASDIDELWVEFGQFTAEEEVEDLVRSKSPSFRFYEPDDGIGTAVDRYKSIPGGAPGLGKRKS